MAGGEEGVAQLGQWTQVTKVAAVAADPEMVGKVDAVAVAAALEASVGTEGEPPAAALERATKARGEVGAEAAAVVDPETMEVLRCYAEEAALGGQDPLCCPRGQWVADEVQGVRGRLECACPMGVRWKGIWNAH